MQKSAIAILIVVLSVGPVAAETQPSAWPPKHRHAADVMSWVFVSSNVALDSLWGWKRPDRKHALKCLALRFAITSAAAHTTKLLVHRERPDGSDNHSFYSGHTAFGFVSAGWSPRIGLPLALGTAYGRAAANRHYWSDIAAGAGAGLTTTLACKP